MQTPIEPSSAGVKTRLIAGLAIMALTGVYVAITYSSLPQTMPIHFNAAGNPDGWAGRQYAAFFGLGCQLFMLAVFGGVYWAMSDPARMGGKYSSFRDFTPEQILAFRPKLMIFIDGLYYPLMIMFAYLQYVTNEVGLMHRETIGIGVWFFLGFIIIWSIILSVVVIIESQKVKNANKNESE